MWVSGWDVCFGGLVGVLCERAAGGGSIVGLVRGWFV